MHTALERLRAMIILGDLQPGEQIRQQEMADALGVSRVPLREAMNLLADQGLLWHRRNQGYFVARRLPEEVVQVRRLLYLLENELIATLGWPERAALAELRALNQHVAAAIAVADLARVSELNRQFHLGILALSPYAMVRQEVERLWARLDPVFMAKLTRPEYVQRMVDEHDAILDQLAARNRDELVRVMNLHRYGGGPVPQLTPAGQPEGEAVCNNV